MSLQAMPIAAQMLMPGYQAQHIGGERVPVPDEISVAAKTATRFNFQVASELYWRGAQNDYHLGKDFGSLRLPYPTCWVEWEWPATMVIHGKEAPATNEIRFAAGMVEQQLDKNRFRISTQLITQQPPHPVTFVEEVGDSIEVDRDGNYIDGTRRWSYRNDLNKVEVHQLTTWLGMELNVVYLALNLINCKNVTTEIAGHVSVRRSGSAKRRKEPRLDYHTIVLPGMSTGAGAAAANLDVMPLHRVRGHFKTFAAERPLMGKFTGTYWWGWQVRGSKKNGIVVSDYKVGAL